MPLFRNALLEPLQRLRSLTTTSYAGRVMWVTLAGFVLRAAFLGRQPLWRDEAFTALAEQHSTGAMLDIVRNDSAPPLAYLLVHLVAQISTSEAALRVVSVLGGTAVIPLAAALARRVAGDRAGIWAAALCAVIPTTVLSSRDGRMYALATALVMGATLALWRAVEAPSLWRWVLYIVLSGAALNTSYFAIFAVVAQFVAVAVVLRPRFRIICVTAVACALSVAALVPWLAYAAHTQLAHQSQGFWVQPVSVSTLTAVVSQFLGGPPMDPTIQGRTTIQTLEALAGLAGWIAIACLVLSWWRGPTRTRPFLFLLVCGLGGVALLAATSVWHPLLEARYASVIWGPLLALLGVGLAWIRWWPIRAVLLSAGAAASIATTLFIIHPQTQLALARVESQFGSHDIIDVGPSTYLIALYYADPTVRSRSHVFAKDTVVWYWGTAAYPPDAVVPGVPSDVVTHNGTVWFVDDPSRPKPDLGYGYRSGIRECWVSVCVTPYRR